MSNLLTNAIKFTPAGGRVAVKLEHGGSHSSISVTDTGVGIAADFLPHLFDRFRQADSSTTRRHGGLGLGLDHRQATGRAARRLGVARAARARARARRSSCDCPRAISRSSGAGGGRSRRSGSPGGPTRFRRTMRVPGVKVLVVEDEPDTRELVERLLSEAGCR